MVFLKGLLIGFKLSIIKKNRESQILVFTLVIETLTQMLMFQNKRALPNKTILTITSNNHVRLLVNTQFKVKLLEEGM
jgi:hypothetical protein